MDNCVTSNLAKIKGKIGRRQRVGRTESKEAERKRRTRRVNKGWQGKIGKNRGRRWEKVGSKAVGVTRTGK